MRKISRQSLWWRTAWNRHTANRKPQWTQVHISDWKNSSTLRNIVVECTTSVSLSIMVLGIRYHCLKFHDSAFKKNTSVELSCAFSPCLLLFYLETHAYSLDKPIFWRASIDYVSSSCGSLPGSLAHPSPILQKVSKYWVGDIFTEAGESRMVKPRVSAERTHPWYMKE